MNKYITKKSLRIKSYSFAYLKPAMCVTEGVDLFGVGYNNYDNKAVWKSSYPEIIFSFSDIYIYI